MSMSKDFLGVLNGLRKVAVEYGSELSADIRKQYGFVNFPKARPVMARMFYGEVHFDRASRRSFVGSLPRSFPTSLPSSSWGRGGEIAGAKPPPRLGYPPTTSSGRHYHTQATPIFSATHRNRSPFSEAMNNKRTECTDTGDNNSNTKSKVICI